MLAINNIWKHKIGNISLYINVGALKKSLIETVLLSAQEHMYWFRKTYTCTHVSLETWV